MVQGVAVVQLFIMLYYNPQEKLKIATTVLHKTIIIVIIIRMQTVTGDLKLMMSKCQLPNRFMEEGTFRNL